jgi:hypothetical protein
MALDERDGFANKLARPAHLVILGLEPRIHAACTASMVGSNPTMTTIEGFGRYSPSTKAVNFAEKSLCQRDSGGRFSMTSPIAQAMRRSSSARGTSLSGQRM